MQFTWKATMSNGYTWNNSMVEGAIPVEVSAGQYQPIDLGPNPIWPQPAEAAHVTLTVDWYISGLSIARPASPGHLYVTLNAC